MTSPAWHWYDQLSNMGYSPDDIEPDTTEPPTCIIVEYFAPVSWLDEETGTTQKDRVPYHRQFPLFMAKAADRYAEYCRRKYGAKNVSVEYD